MALRIVCPHCQHGMSLKTPKAGKFKPKCSSCGQTFSLVIGEGDPPTAVATPLPAPAPAPATVIDRTLGAAGLDATIEVAPPTAPARPPAAKTLAAMEATLDTSLPVSQITGLGHAANDATIESLPPAAMPANQTAPDRPQGTQATSRPPKRAAATVVEFSVGHQTEASAAKTTAPERLGGYRIVKELGAGGMGAVYLAKQISLDRAVALKTIQAQWAASPRVIARFIREAYAAAQLTHHNVVQIYDLGEESGTNYFSMELVGGGSLDDMLKQRGALPPKTAAMLILQAARGLKFAHDHGMVHRDIKPANLMLTGDGMVKVADLGLVKTPQMDDEAASTSAEEQNLMLASARSNVTYQGTTMGTPAYMSPEQADDASSVDHRADIYSLGCTFYALLTGRPPFISNSALEILTKHKIEKLPRPETIVDSVPGALGDIIDRMTAKRPDDRYADLGQTIHDLEVFLGLAEPVLAAASPGVAGLSSGQPGAQATRFGGLDATMESMAPAAPATAAPPKPRAEATPAERNALEAAAKALVSLPLALVQRWVPNLGLLAAPALVLLVALVSFRWATCVAVMAVTTPLAALVFAAMHGRGVLAKRWLRSWRVAAWTDWLYWSVGALLAATIAYALGLWLGWLVAIILGAAIGIGWVLAVEEPLRKAQTEPLQRFEAALKQLRLRGLDEGDVRRLAAQHAGGSASAVLEAALGYDAMRAAMASSPAVGWLNAVGTIRQRWIDRLDEHWDRVQQARDRQTLAKVETASLVASGVSAAEAQQRAAQQAEALVEVAAEARGTMNQLARGQLSAEDAAAKRQRFRQMMAEARSGKVQRPSLASRSVGFLMNQLFGAKLRFMAGALLVAGFAMWAKQNNLFSTEAIQELQSATQNVTEAADATAAANSALQSAQNVMSTWTSRPTEPLAVPGLGWLFQGWGPAVAGVLLVLSGLMSGWRITLWMLPAVVVCLFGSAFGIPAVSSWLSSESLSALVGGMLGTAAIWLNLKSANSPHV